MSRMTIAVLAAAALAGSAYASESRFFYRAQFPAPVAAATHAEPMMQMEGPAVALGTRPYRATAQVWNGKAPMRFEVVSGRLPEGLALDASSGTVEGRPGAVGFASVMLSVTDAAGAKATAPLVIDVVEAARGRLAAAE